MHIALHIILWSMAVGTSVWALKEVTIFIGSILGAIDDCKK